MNKNINTSQCYAKKNKGCAITINSCCTQDCAFFKTKDQYERDFLITKMSLEEMGLVDEMKEKYSAFATMCKRIKENSLVGCGV